MRDLVLTGFMGTGKSTVGKALAESYGFQFVDVDAVVERMAGKTIADIFATEGENRFRQLETDALRSLQSGYGRIIATGGGALISEENRALLSGDQRVFCLTCEADELRMRLVDTSDRPMLAAPSADRLGELLAARAPAYACFEQIDTSKRAPEDVARIVAGRAGLIDVGMLQFESKRASRLVLRRGLHHQVGKLLIENGRRDRALVVTDTVVASIPGGVETVLQSLESAGIDSMTTVLPAGEEYKTLDSLSVLYKACMDQHLDRQSTIVGLGGGVVCDIAGMLAATYVRGVNLALLPTTLLAQVDAAIGGKVGVDFEKGKNLVGAFYPADLILIDPDLLRTLPGPILADGLVEAVKIACIRSSDLIARLDALRCASDVLEQVDIIRLAAREKIRVVVVDPYERGERALLNFGHTIGHALEAASEFTLTHGSAVSIGMVAETEIAIARHLCGVEVREKIWDLLVQFGLPVKAPHLDPDAVAGFVAHDKKRSSGEVRMALPTGLGAGTIVSVSPQEVRDAIDGAVGVTG